ncbi:MAG: hypothetical protein U0531_14590 [Dehalococcoidia bacterium]
MQPVRRTERADGPALLLDIDDLRRHVRRGQARSTLVLLCVDASGSLGARPHGGNQGGGVVAPARRLPPPRPGRMVAFAATAEVVLPPTSGADLAERRLRALPTGGPYAARRRHSAETSRPSRLGRSADVEPLLVLISDVRPNVGAPGQPDPWRAALAAASQVKAAGWQAVVLDTEPPRAALGLGRTLAAAMGARHLKIDHLRAGAIEQAIHTVQGM